MIGSRTLLRLWTSASVSVVSIALSAIPGCGKDEPSSDEAGIHEARDSQRPSSVDDGARAALPDAGTLAYSLAMLSADQRRVIDAALAMRAKPISALTPEVAREAPTLKDAVAKVLADDGLPTALEKVAKVETRQIPGVPVKLNLTIYTPKKGRAPRPVIVYFHGGGWVIGNDDAYEASARALANAAQAVVVSVDPRLAPENTFPAAHDDAFAAYKWVLRNVSKLQGDARRIALVGESSGGNLAANVVISARDKRERLPAAAVLVCPVAIGTLESASYSEHAKAEPLNESLILWFAGHYVRSAANARDPRISLVDADLRGLPPITIISAEVDPLRSDGELLAKRLEEAGVDVVHKTYRGVAHEFFGQGAVVQSAKDAVAFSASRIAEAFKK